jgi:Rieske Fe-S protein
MTDRKSRRTILKAVASLPAVTFGLMPGANAKGVEEKAKKPPAAVFHEDDFDQEWAYLPFIVKADPAAGTGEASDVRGYVMRLPSGDFAAYSRHCRELGCKFEFVKEPAVCKERFDFEPTGPVLACHCHKSVFDLIDGGKVVHGPERSPLQSFAVKRCHDKVCVLPFESSNHC